MTTLRRLRQAVITAGAGALITVAGCSGPPGQDLSASAPRPQAGAITVFAAASLRAPFTEIGRLFEVAHPGITVRFNFAGSSDLVAQLQQGAPADVLASADSATMDRAAADDLLSGAPRTFATNAMAVAVPPDNPAMISTFADLTDPGVSVVVCAPQVPCGAATEQVQANAGVTVTTVSEESSVADVLNKVATGEADAGVVYVTDVQAADGRVIGIAIPADLNAVTTYPIAVLAGSSSPTLAEQFQALVTGPQGHRVLSEAGFGDP